MFLAVWVLAALGMGQSKCHEYQNVSPVHVLKIFSADELDIRGIDEAAMIEKFRKVLARDITSTVTVPSCIAIPTTDSSGSWTSATVVTVTIPGSSIPGGDSSIPTSSFPTSSTDTDTSIPLPTTWPFPGTTIPGLPTTIPGLPTTIPGLPTTNPGLPTTIPLSDTTVPGESGSLTLPTTIPGTIPLSDTTVPGESGSLTLPTTIPGTMTSSTISSYCFSPKPPNLSFHCP
ncbi:hypothetical protein T310_6345 [Rasamsonia emersonii CBS 393.64]|uniref:Uncharacterized protein n=1 Tax=Rasamsonia emersonii (strain ATCC 16479 / CBS 393.64 / IMI 116815) TaxID=1408163 RepID=A0A0F4YN59_RASE3|nr:hypothetical protein T310_6345 [Rasamsonia emersonii CBS 393.64]KKA19659.1 hypothetical protein T310_6345 [Rasamsonia emersonii CBS 393.64]